MFTTLEHNFPTRMERVVRGRGGGNPKNPLNYICGGKTKMNMYIVVAHTHTHREKKKIKWPIDLERNGRMNY